MFSELFPNSIFEYSFVLFVLNQSLGVGAGAGIVIVIGVGVSGGGAQMNGNTMMCNSQSR